MQYITVYTCTHSSLYLGQGKLLVALDGLQCPLYTGEFILALRPVTALSLLGATESYTHSLVFGHFGSALVQRGKQAFTDLNTLPHFRLVGKQAADPGHAVFAQLTIAPEGRLGPACMPAWPLELFDGVAKLTWSMLRLPGTAVRGGGVSGEEELRADG
jgi:hypothetical protein